MADSPEADPNPGSPKRAGEADQSPKQPTALTEAEALELLRTCFDTGLIRFSYHQRKDNAHRRLTGPVLHAAISHTRARVYEVFWDEKFGNYRYRLSGYYRDYQLGISFAFEKFKDGDAERDAVLIVTAYVVGMPDGALPAEY
ncbi:MAG: hypothetical protein KF858_07860 [Candidatus Sumerlaeia bacterium]|nr:hypothetical protein [Candidatus Sumerlaeia bacterium]